ncbi:hypothetical protein Tco_1406139 [Tanacetum coccineum]
MGDENPIHDLGDYSKPSHEGYMNTIELPVGNNVVPLQSDTIQLVQNGCSFHGLRSEDPNQHLNDFLKLVDSLDLDDANRERTQLRLFQFSLRDQASNWLESKDKGAQEGSPPHPKRYNPKHLGSKENATLSGLRNSDTIKESRLLIEFWPSIGEGGFNVGNTKVASIRDPRIKLAHRCIATTIAGRKETTHRVTEIDLYCIYTPEVACNIPYWLSKYLKAVRDKNLIYGGMLVTKIARSFGLFTEELRDALSIEPPPHVFKKKSVIAMGVLMELPNGICFYVVLSSDSTYKIACRKFLIKNEEEFFTEARDGISIIPNSAASPAMLYLTRRFLEVLRKFHLTTLGGRFNYNYGVTCKDEAKRSNSGAKTKTFEENCYLLLYVVEMDDLNITMEEYIRLAEEKSQRHGRTFNWQIATFGKIENYEDEDDCSIDFKTEFPAIVFDNTFNTTLPCETTISPPNESKIDFRISLDEFDDEDYTVIFDENSFSHKIISVKDLKTDSGNDMPSSPEPTIDYLNDLDYFNNLKNEFPTIVYNDGLTSKPNLEVETPEFHGGQDMAPLPPSDQRHPWLRYQVEGYTLGFDSRDEAGFGRETEDGIYWGCRIEDICEMMDLDTADTLCFQLGGVMEEAGFGAYWAGSKRLIPDKGDLRDYWVKISSDKYFLGPAPFYVFIRDPVRRLCHGMIAYNISGRGRHLRRLLGGHFIGRLAAHFGLVGDQELRGLHVVTYELPLIDLHELRRLNICTRYGDTWTWVASGPERQQAVAVGAHEGDEGGSAVEESVVGLRGVVESFITKQTRVSTWMISCMTQLMDASGRTYQAFNSTLVGSSWMPYQRHVRPRTGDASTFAAPHVDDQPDP